MNISVDFLDGSVQSSINNCAETSKKLEAVEENSNISLSTLTSTCDSDKLNFINNTPDISISLISKCDITPDDMSRVETNLPECHLVCDDSDEVDSIDLTFSGRTRTVIVIDEKDSTDPEIVNTSSHKEASLKRKLSCEICGKSEAIYTCPCCELKTCSLPCVKEHKRRLGCCGERIKTAFVDKSEYGDGHLLNDYRLLEDANRKLYSFKASHDNKRNNAFSGTYINKRTKLLSTAAYKRGIKLQVLSQALSKHKNNTSYYTIKSDKILWHIVWCFVASNTELKNERVPEDTVLLGAAREWVNFLDHPELRKPLKDYEKDNLEKSQFLLKIECLPANRIRYFKLNPCATIADNLKGHCLTEYPSIYVVPPQYKDLDKLVLLSADDLSFMEPSNYHHMKHLVVNQADLEAQLMNPRSHIYTPQAVDVLER